MSKEGRTTELQRKSGYHFSDQRLLVKALTHTSYANEHKMGHLDSNEQLEFLGDAVLELISSDFLFHHYPEKREGELTTFRASLVCEATLAYDAKALDLSEYLFLGRGEDQTGGRGRDSIVSDALEALIGAIYLDGGLEAAKAFILRFVLDDPEKKHLFRDSKTKLQEWAQSLASGELVYKLLSETGPDHKKSFTVAVLLDGKTLGKGTGSSKKAASQQAAYEALLHLAN